MIERACLAAHHQRQFGVGLELDEAEHHLRAGALQVARPADIGLLVETRLQLDQSRDRFAGFRRLDQGADDGAVGRGAIERLLDRHDIGVARRLHQELHHHVEGFVGVVDDEILLLDGQETVAAIVAHPLRETRGIGKNLRSGRGRLTTSDRSFIASMPSSAMTSSARNVKLLGDEGAQVVRHMRVGFEPDHRTAPAPLQRGLEQAHQVFRLFLDFEIAVADHPERRPAPSPDSRGTISGHG